ncbi:hypothetical protein B0H14DRAFT_3714011 [Mycena olivaceomarginata]|nr:hypothetical protein B0H14DRAFT_3714011 [Mycena olivaceomarginata]
MDESSNISSPSSGFDYFPMTPVSENEAPSSPPPDTTPATLIPERKVTICVPVEYIPPVPPPSASLPVIPPRRQSSVPGGFANGKTKVPKMILMSQLQSAIHVPTAAEQMKQSTSEKPARYGAELLPTATPGAMPASSRPHRDSAPGQPNTAFEPAPVTIRKSPSISNSPAHVSHIDFRSFTSDEDGEYENENELHTPSITDEGHAQQPSHARMVVDESDLSRWAPQPAYFPNQSNSILYSVNQPPAPHTQGLTQTRLSASPSLHSNDREGSLTESASTRRGPAAPREHHTHTERMQRDMDFTMRALMSPEIFANMLSDPLARQRFREFLAGDGNTGTTELDFWTDAQFLAQSMEQLRANVLAFRNLYISNSGETHVPLPLEVRRDLLGALQHVISADASLDSTQARLLESMYNDQLQRFVKHKIIQATHVTLGKVNPMSQASEGLGDTFILTNPRLPDHPIVLVSDGFVDVTGYPRAQGIGRNCRFLQGPGTPPESVQRIRDGLNSGKGCNGEPFYCLLCIIPIHDTSGAIVYFIGGQTNVTGLLATDKGLGLYGSSAGDGGAPQPIQMSPALAMLRGHASDPGMLPTHSGAAADLDGDGDDEAGRETGHCGCGGGDECAWLTWVGGSVEPYLLGGFVGSILIFKFKKREITFVSPRMLAFLGLPTRTQRDLHSSPLIRNDIACLVTAGEDQNETRRLREELKDNIRRGMPCSLYCAVKIPGKGILPSDERVTQTQTDSARHKFGMMHMTPIKDRDNVAVAFVVILGRVLKLGYLSELGRR